MELKLARPLLFFDIESTGLSIATNGIIELSFVKVMPEGGAPLVKTWKIKPWDYKNRRVIHINPSASDVNGVKDEDLVDCP
jgi:DNA polymerase-3 subunit epsilon